MTSPSLETPETGLPFVPIAIIGMIVLAICWRLGVFRPVRTRGQARLGEGESPFTLLVVLACGFVGASLLASFPMQFFRLSEIEKKLMSAASLYAIAFVLLIGVNAAIRKQGSQRLGINPRRIVQAIPVAIIALLLTFPVVYMAAQGVETIRHQLGYPTPAPHQLLKELGTSNDPAMIRLLIIMATVLAPLAEETIFRGLLQTFISSITRMPWVGITTSAALFAMVHLEPAFMFPLFLLAIALGWVYERTGNLWATILMHALFNTFQVILYLKQFPRH